MDRKKWVPPGQETIELDKTRYLSGDTFSKTGPEKDKQADDLRRQFSDNEYLRLLSGEGVENDVGGKEKTDLGYEGSFWDETNERFIELLRNGEIVEAGLYDKELLVNDNEKVGKDVIEARLKLESKYLGNIRLTLEKRKEVLENDLEGYKSGEAGFHGFTDKEIEEAESNLSKELGVIDMQLELVVLRLQKISREEV